MASSVAAAATSTASLDGGGGFTKFRSSVVKGIVQKIMKERLGKLNDTASEGLFTATTDGGGVSTLSKQIADEIRDTVLGQCKIVNSRYKVIVNVLIGEQQGQGIRMGCKCLWDPDMDTMVTENYSNDSLFAVVTVYGVFTA